jgi:hypothetical protein
MSTDLAGAITRDILDGKTAQCRSGECAFPNCNCSKPIIPCLSCGARFVYKGPQGDGSGRFCSDRCREWCDAGNQRAEDNPGIRPTEANMPGLYGLRGWKVIAGPPGIEIGSEYYAGIIAASDRKRAESAGDLIRPRKLCARCGAKLPVWIKGRKVPSSRKLCDACQR